MTLLADSLASELLIYPCNCLLLKIQVDSHQKRLSFWARTNLSSTLARAERRSEFYKISQSQSERDRLQVNWERDSLQWGWMFCSPWRKPVSWLGEKCSPRDKENHEQREDHFSTQRNREPGPQELDPGHRGKTHVTSLQELERDWNERTMCGTSGRSSGETWQAY